MTTWIPDDTTPYGQGTAITPDPAGDVPAPESAPQWARSRWADGWPGGLPYPSRVTRSASLYDAMVPRLRLGNGHARFALRGAVQLAALFRDEAWVTVAVDHLIRPECREGIARQLRHLVRSAIDTTEEKT